MTLVGNGKVRGDGIDCGTDCSQNYPSGQAVTLTATPATDWQFQGWSSDGDSQGQVTLASDKVCTATFATSPPPPPAEPPSPLPIITG